MTAPAAPSLTEELAAALDWWRDAGVDRAFRDESEGWLSAPPEEAAAAAEADRSPAAPKFDRPVAFAPKIGGDPTNWPHTLEAFAGWWLNEPTLDGGGVGPRIAPRGPAGAELMIVVAMPEAEDSERLLSGGHGRFLDAVLAAFGLSSESVYFASALTRHTPLPDPAQLAAGGLGAVLEHHVRLAAPKRLITFGRLVPPLLGHDMAQGPAATPIFNHEGLRLPVMAAGGLERLLRSAAAREAFWRHWLDWTNGKP